MGDHYAPQRYLLGFCESVPPNRIWVYDRTKKRCFPTTVRNVAQENGFYSPEDEVALNKEVESPANPVLAALRSGCSLTTEVDRLKLALYIATFMYRVPYQRALSAEMAPAILSETIEEVKNFIQQEGQRQGIDPEKIRRKLEEVDQYHAKYACNPTEPILDRIRSPWPSEAVYQGILDMTWRFAQTTGPSYFLTSDNPVYFFQWLGVSRPDSEISFPISSNLLLHASMIRGKDGERVDVDQKFVKEMNRRTASKSTRFLFYYKEESWVAQLADKGPTGHRLNRINWIAHKYC